MCKYVDSVSERSKWEHLLQYGYAPGHYMRVCCKCKQIATDIDKRAIICLPCAELRHAQFGNNSSNQQE
jgi:hypothetical protein